MVDFLRAQGLVIVGQNLRLGYLELDVVAVEGRVVVVVEVRARSEGATLTIEVGDSGPQPPSECWY